MFSSWLAKGANPPTIGLCLVGVRATPGAALAPRAAGTGGWDAGGLGAFSAQARGGQQRPLPRRRSRGEILGGPLAALRDTAYCAARNGAGGEPLSPPLRVTVVAVRPGWQAAYPGSNAAQAARLALQRRLARRPVTPGQDKAAIDRLVLTPPSSNSTPTATASAPRASGWPWELSSSRLLIVAGQPRRDAERHRRHRNRMSREGVMARPAAPNRALRAARAMPPQAGRLGLPVRSLARRRNRSRPPPDRDQVG
jgi:hypothetical protein